MTREEELNWIVSQITPRVQEMLQSSSLSPDEIETSLDIEGINSLPAIKKAGGIEKVVLVPLSKIMLGAEIAGLGDINNRLDEIESRIKVVKSTSEVNI